MSKIPLFKVTMSESAAARVTEVLASGYVGQGPRVEEFEKMLRAELRSPRDVLTVNSGTSALDLAMHLVGVGPGDEVVTTPQTCTATNGVIVNRQARIVWADVDPRTGNIDPIDVARKVTRRTKAVVAVDWGGRACDYNALLAIGLPVVEDAAHAYLTESGGRSVAEVGGDYVCYSFQAIKHLTTADGGALVAPADQVERARLLRWFGLDRRSSSSFRCEQTVSEAGFKYQMNDVAAAIGIANVGRARDAVRASRANAAWYHGALAGLSGVSTPAPDVGSSWWLYTLLVDDRASFTAFMAGRDIDVSPVHARNDVHPAFRGFGAPLPGVDWFASREVAIPSGWWVTEEDRERVADAVVAWSRRKP